MKMKTKLKPFISLLLAFMLALGLAPVSLFDSAEALAATETPSGDLSGILGNSISWELTEMDPKPENWIQDSSNTPPYKLTISGTGEMTNFEYSDSAPWAGHRYWIYEIEISNGITSIGDNAFYLCNSIESIHIPSSVTSIGNSAFYDCNLLETVSVSKGSKLKTIGSYAFASTNNNGRTSSLETFPLNETSLQSIGSSAFRYSRLTNVTLPGSVTAIGPSAFASSSLRTIQIPTGVTRIESSTFSGCSSLTSVSNLSNVTYIGDSAFSSCQRLNSISNLSKVTDIGTSAFSGCSALTGITLGNGLKTIGDSSFYSSGLQKIELLTSVAGVKIGDSAFQECSSLSTVTTGSGIKTIGSYAFYKCTSLTTVNLGSGARTIGSSAFSECSSLKNINFNSVETINDNAFKYANLSAGVDLPNTLISIGTMAFANTSLKSFTVPQNVSSISHGILYHCTQLDSIDVEAKNKYFAIAAEALYQTSNPPTDLLNPPDLSGRVIAYPIHKNDASYKIADEMISVDQYAFACSNIQELHLPDSITTLENHSFENCNSLTSVYVGKNTNNIKRGPSGAFKGCTSLRKFAMETDDADSILIVDDDVLYTANYGALYFYPFAKKNVAADASDKFPSLDEFHVPDNVESVESYAIYNVPALTELYFPDTLKNLFSNAISSNSSLKSIYFAGDAPKYNSSAIASNAPDRLLFRQEGTTGWDNGSWRNFDYGVWDNDMREQGDAMIETGESEDPDHPFSWKYEKFNRRLTLSGTTYMPNYASDHTGLPWESFLNEIQTIEAAAENIGDYAFYGAENLLRLSTKSKPSTIGEAAFADCPNLIFLSFNAMTAIGEEAFSNDGALRGTWDGSLAEWNLSNIKSIGAGAFRDCTSISRINLTNNNLTELPEETFAGCSGLTQLSLPSGLLTIGARALAGCSDLQYAYSNNSAFAIPSTVTTIGDSAFSGCSALRSITIPNNLTALNSGVFEDCSALADLTISTSSMLSSIGTRAFSGCSALKSILIPDRVSAIGNEAFLNDKALEDVLFQGVMPAMNADAFSGCDNKTTVLFYKLEKDADQQWEKQNGIWNGFPVKRLDRFYTAGRDHYRFPNSASSFGYSYDYRIPRQRYVDVLDSIVKGTYYYAVNRSWGGSCYGMASTSLEFYENINQKESFDLKNYSDTDIKSLFILEAPSKLKNEYGDNVTKLIEAYQISQFRPEIAACSGEINKHWLDFEGLKSRVKKFSEKGSLSVDAKATPVVIAVYSLFGGHALVPISWKLTENGDFAIEVYDCNYPFQTQTMTLNKNGIDFEYGFYSLAFSYVDYTTIAEGMSDVTLYSAANDDSLYLSIDNENGTVANAEGKGVDEIDGAYEQKPFTSEAETFSGIKSYVLPSGGYTLTAQTTAEDDTQDADGEENADDTDTLSDADNTNDADDAGNADDVTFFMAAEDLFAEVTASDETAELSVNTAGDDKAELSLTSGEGAENDETVNITLVDANGMEREIGITNYNNEEIQVAVTKENSISITAPASADVEIDGQEAAMQDGKIDIPFISNTFSVKNLQLENVSCNSENELSGTITAEIVSNFPNTIENAKLTVEYYAYTNTRIAQYTEERTINPGRNTIELTKDSLSADFSQMSGDVPIHCRLSISDSQQTHLAFAQSNAKIVTVTNQNPDPDDTETESTETESTETESTETENTETENTETENTETESTETENTETENTETESTEQGGPSNITGGSTETPAPPASSEEQKTVAVTAVSATPKKITIGVGESFQVKTTVTPADATDKTVSYKASNKNVSIKNGKVTGKKAGTSWITVKSASNPNATARIQVTVKKAPKKITLNAKSKTLKKGKSFNIKVKLPKNTASNKITFSSSKTSVAKVTAKGKVIALKKGKATITVKTFNGKKAKLKIKVK